MKSTGATVNFSLFLILVGLAAWVVPGAGHWLIRERKRAILIGITIPAIFATGLYIGSLGVLEPIGAAWYLFIGQILTTPAIGVLTDIAQKGQYFVAGRPADFGLIYTVIAGLLNLLCISNAVYMAYCGRGQFIGEDE